MASTSSSSPPQRPSSAVTLKPFPTTFQPELYQRAWSSIPHPTLPLIATSHAKAVTVFSLSTLTKHSALSGGHTRSVRCAAWKPCLPAGKLCLVTGSFDATAGLWRWEKEGGDGGDDEEGREVDVTRASQQSRITRADDDDDNDDDWEFTLVLEGHENEIKSAAFAPSGQYLATCSRDKTVWIWEDVGATEGDDEWETVAVLSEHDGDVKAVAWCPDVPGRRIGATYGSDVLASASYDNTVRVWREDADAEWVCVAVLEGHDETVWGLQWEPRPDNPRFPRLMTFSADGTVRIWTLQVDEEEEAQQGPPSSGSDPANPFHSGMRGIPNTMRRGLREDWACTAVLPAVHTRDIYSAAWSGGASGMIASTGSDGIIAVYGEEKEEEGGGDGQDTTTTTTTAKVKKAAPAWRVLGTVSNGHGMYEINHVTWCKRFDAGAERKGVDEMLVTTGDDGVVRPWEVLSV